MTKTTADKNLIHKTPTDLQEVLNNDTKILMLWNSLTLLARNEWICWITSVKKIETRKNHIKRLSVELREGKRRPCCRSGCPHRKLGKLK